MTVGYKTLDTGEQALIYNLRGEARIESGPQRLFLWREKCIRLQCYHANQSQYLRLCHKDGHIAHRAGPCALFLNPLKHTSIQVKDGVSLDASEVLVVYKLDKKTGDVRRYLKNGPTIYIPDANEWLHEFAWHGTDPDNKTRKLPGLLRFTKLQVIPDQFYYNVDEVRTADDALMRVKLMIFYEFKDIEKMLNSTSDPIADFINCVTADLIVFTSNLTYMEFIEKSGDLNNLEQYPQLLERCKVIGAEVTKVVFRGYYASPKLQQTHDNAIQARTRLQMQYEREEQEQLITDLRMKNEKDRTKLEQDLELNALLHKQEIEKCESDHKLSLKKQDQVVKAQHIAKEKEAKLQAATLDNAHKLDHYKALRDLEVDLTQFLLSQNPQPAKVVKVIADDKAAVMHFHHN